MSSKEVANSLGMKIIKAGRNGLAIVVSQWPFAFPLRLRNQMKCVWIFAIIWLLYETESANRIRIFSFIDVNYRPAV